MYPAVEISLRPRAFMQVRLHQTLSVGVSRTPHDCTNLRPLAPAAIGAYLAGARLSDG